MATLDDKILGEKLQYYCSSSEDEGANSDSGKEDDNEKVKSVREHSENEVTDFTEWNGTSSNTGPKGVIRDWQRYKQLEIEKKEEKEKEKLALMKKLSLSCRSTLDEERDKLEASDPDMAELLDSEFLLEYQKQRMHEMIASAQKLRFGSVIDLETADKFLAAVDEENKTVTVIIHIYQDGIVGCDAMNGSLITLAEDYPFVKFCRIKASAAGLSKHFKKEGVPALLVYKNKQLMGNFVRLSENLGDDFYAQDVQNFLIEHGMLVDKECVPAIITNNQNDSDSD